MDLYRAMRTTFAAREFKDEPVSDQVLTRILDNARFAPSGGNRQGWRVIVVREQATKDALADLAEPAAKRYVAQQRAGESPWNPIEAPKVDASTIEATRPPSRLIDPFRRAPILLVIGVDLRVVAATDQHLKRVGVISGASIYPFAWNILLAANAEGLGGTITTFAVAQETKVQALLGMPEHVAVCAVMPLGVPVAALRRLTRKPVGEFAVRERWDGRPLSERETDPEQPF